MESIEIQDIKPLTADQQALLDMHSVANAASVIRSDLAMLGLLLAKDELLLEGAIDACDDLLDVLPDRRAGLAAATDADAFVACVVDLVAAKVAADVDRLDHPEVTELMTNLTSVCQILQDRMLEVVDRAATPELWRTAPCTDVRNAVEVFLAAVEKNSRGRYGIRHNVTNLRPNDYYVSLNVESTDGEISMPPVFSDVLRDLIANARKYTPPGGKILAAVFEDEHALRFSVRDTGRGIPAGELKQVVEFGQRGSNVADIRTMGGGFGLTKAFVVAQQFGGRFWLSSTQDEGTCVKIWLPRPSAQK